MNIKLILGIFVPLLLIIFLVILSTVNIGFSIDKETVNSVQFNSLFTNQYDAKKSITIQTITINNGFFMPKKIELPKLIVCLNDKEALKQRINLQVRYSESRHSKVSNIPVFEDLVYDSSYYSSTQSIEISANTKKQIRILAEPLYNSNVYSYVDYDELLLIQSKDNSIYYYNSCQNIKTEELDNAIHIDITEIPVVIGSPTPNSPFVTISTYRNISECDKFTDIDKDNCYIQVAIATGNINVCEIISNPISKSECYSQIASNYGNYSICYNLPGNVTNAKDWCIANTAVRRQERFVCNNVEYQFARDKCFQNIR